MRIFSVGMLSIGLRSSKELSGFTFKGFLRCFLSVLVGVYNPRPKIPGVLNSLTNILVSTVTNNELLEFIRLNVHPVYHEVLYLIYVFVIVNLVLKYLALTTFHSMEEVKKTLRNSLLQ